MLALIFWELIAYGFGQAQGQFEIIRNARPLEEVLADENIADSLKSKIQLVSEIRQYAIDSIGLSDSDNYTTFYDQEGRVLLWNLSGCEPFQFIPKMWSFPLLGSFPYKGFFELEKAKEEQAELIAENYDTRIRPVGGWSTLGWFTDPILSNMLQRSEGRLADLIIHELTHATLFVKDDIEFNENLASFIGERGAQEFLQFRYGAESAEYSDYKLHLEDNKQFTKHILTCTKLLDSLYTSFDEHTSDSVKAFQKHVMIDEIASSLDTIFFHNSRYNQIFQSGRPNNAYFMSFLRYHSSEDSLSVLLKKEYSNDLEAFVDGMRTHHSD